MLNIGFVGLGHNGVAHMKTHLALGRSNVVALCERNAERLAEASALAPDAKATTGDEIYTDPDVDAISVHTGDGFHVEPFVRALEAGKHVFVEKPVANSLEQIAEMYRAWRDTDRSQVVAVGYVLRWNPVFEAVARLCHSGRLGTVYYLEGDYIHNLVCQKDQADPTTGRNWYLEEERPMVGGGSHPLDLLRWFTRQEVIEVSAYGAHQAFPEMHNEDCQVALFRFDGGAIAKVAALYGPITAMAKAYNVRVYGTEGTTDRDQVALRQDANDVHPEYGPVCDEQVAGHPYDGEIVDWIDSIEQGREPRVPFWDGANSTIATLSAVEALRQGRPQAVPHVSSEREWIEPA
jgi:predicted dehydrogenase